MPDRKKALIAGATGVVGRNLLRHLLALDGWDVIAVSRRKPDVDGRYEHVAVDLLDRAQTFEALKRPRGVTHVFFSAYIERPTWAEMVAPNQTMLVNLMDAIETASPDLAHVNLIHGTKWYGNHLGPFKTPAKEDDPRHMPPNLLSRALVWMATDSRCANEPFNVTNGDLIRWENLWPKMASYFRMEVGPRQHIKLTEMMADKASLWDRIVAQHGLRRIPYDQIVSWGYGDFVFGAGFDIISSMTKARRYGFHEAVDTEEMFFRMFDELRASKVIP
ncbi:MAG: NAD-dependent epimerase/dehydratase family protein [Xanthobacteraceae bacterium]